MAPSDVRRPATVTSARGQAVVVAAAGSRVSPAWARPMPQSEAVRRSRSWPERESTGPASRGDSRHSPVAPPPPSKSYPDPLGILFRNSPEDGHGRTALSPLPLAWSDASAARARAGAELEKAGDCRGRRDDACRMWHGLLV